MTVRIFILLLLTIITLPSYSGDDEGKKKKKKDYVPTDMASNSPAAYDHLGNQRFKKIVGTSMYMTMRDSVKIAVNVYLPKGLEEGEKIPVIVYQTRYWRGARFRWPFNMFLNNFVGNAGKMIKEVILNGYALVAVDARGSGASMGDRLHPWTMDEIKDGAEIVDWAIAQPWCNGKVGAAGISYSGTTAEMLLVNKHPAVKAVAPMFSLFDVYDDISLPGGLHLVSFTKTWGEANEALDNSKLPSEVKGIARLAVKGVQPVKGYKKLLKEAIIDHQENTNVNDGAEQIVYRDDAPAGPVIVTPQLFSPMSYTDDIDEGGAAVYSISGYYDGDYQHAAVKRHLTLTNPQNKLILGPWEHGGWLNCSPGNPGESAFSKPAELLKFFDYHLKGIKTGIYDEPRVHYFTMVEEKWKSSNVWPPANSSYQTMHLTGEGKLSENNTTSASGEVNFTVDTTFGTGKESRWMSVLGDLKQPYAYPDWNERTQPLAHFETAKLESDKEMTGHGVVELYLSTTATDGAVHVYISDVDENGKATYVTEGEIRLLHRKECDTQTLHTDAPAIPCHTYLERDGRPMKPGQIEKVRFDILPVSYLFKEGHSIRISISGADITHFKPHAHGAEVSIQTNATYPSKVQLPFVPR